VKKGSVKSQIKSNNTTKHNSVNTSCIRYSYTTSLKNTPKHKKPHTKSEKFYKKYEPAE